MNRKIILTVTVILINLISISDTFSQWEYCGLRNMPVWRVRVYTDLMYACTGNGLYRKSTDAIDTNWTNVGFLGKTVNDIVAFDSVEIIAAVWDPNPGDTATLFKTFNGGTSWAAYQNGLGGFNLYNQGIKNQASVFYYFKPFSDTLYILSDRDIAVSYNKGTTWNSLMGIDTVSLNYLNGESCLNISQLDPTIIYAGGDNGWWEPIIIKSYNSGATWLHKVIGNWSGGCSSILCSKDDIFKVLVCATGKIKVTNDSCLNFTDRSIGNFSSFDLKYSQKFSNRIYTCGIHNDHSLVFYYSTDEFISFDSLRNDITTGQFLSYHMDLHYSIDNNEEQIYFATNLGVYKYVFALNSEKEYDGPLENYIEFYPNPVHEYGNLKYYFNKQYQICIDLIDMTGQTIQNLFCGRFVMKEGILSVKFPSTAKSIYFLRISGEVNYLVPISKQ